MSENSEETQQKPMSQEAGFQNLNTAFTGTKCNAMSGNELFPFTSQDTGVAGTLQDKEL